MRKCGVRTHAVTTFSLENAGLLACYAQHHGQTFPPFRSYELQSTFMCSLTHSEEGSTYLMFCWPCIIVYQYSETNVMNFLFSLLRIKGLYMFRALLAHPQEALNKRHLVYCVRVMSVGCYQDWSVAAFQPTGITRTQYTKCRLFSVSWGWASNARNI
jgi:hypothetical protein